MFNTFRTQLASARASSVYDFVDQFKDKCDTWVYPYSYFVVASKIINADQKCCLIGSMILGANASFKATPYFTKLSDGKVTIEAGNEIENPVAIVGTIDVNITMSEEAQTMQSSMLEPITIISAIHPLKLQYVTAEPSSKLSGTFGKVSFNVGTENIVSTLRKGEVKVGLSAKRSETVSYTHLTLPTTERV